MKPTPIQNPTTSKGEFPKPPPKQNLSSVYELHLGFIAMVQA
jgi:hypothetical protein